MGRDFQEMKTSEKPKVLSCVFISLLPSKREMFHSELCMLHAQSLLSCLTLCDPMDCSPPGSSVHGILQARILEWVARSSFRGSSQSRNQTCVSCISCFGRQVLYCGATWEALYLLVVYLFIQETSYKSLSPVQLGVFKLFSPCMLLHFLNSLLFAL